MVYLLSSLTSSSTTASLPLTPMMAALMLTLFTATTTPTTFFVEAAGGIAISQQYRDPGPNASDPTNNNNNDNNSNNIINDPMRMRPSLPRYLPNECADNLDILLPCWLENSDECNDCVPLDDDGSLGSFLQSFQPPLMEDVASCADLEDPVCPVVNCCSSCEESILELYECWLLVDKANNKIVDESSEDDDEESSSNNNNVNGTQTDIFLLSEIDSCAFECLI